MEDIDHSLLKLLKSDFNNKKIKSKDNHKAMLQFFYSQNNIFKFIQKFDVYELALWIKSRVNYIDRKNICSTNNYPEKSILFVDFGNNYFSELSYEHTCVVLKEGNQKIFVVPCSSSLFGKTTSKKTGLMYPHYIEVLSDDGEFSKNTALILNDAKWVSKNRVISNTGKKVNSKLFKEILDKTLSITFESKYKELINLEKIKIRQENDIEQIRKELKTKDELIEKLKNDLTVMNK